MSVSSAFLWRFLEDVWDILPTQDRQLFETFWSAQIQIASNLQQKTMEAALSTQVSTVPVFLTERWERYILDDESCDLFEHTELITLTLLAAQPLARETALYDTLKVSLATGQIFNEEEIVFFDASVRQLQFAKLIPGTVSVSIGTFEYAVNRDYVVNHDTGTIHALDNGRIPTDVAATIRYRHSEYRRGVDYEIDEIHSTIVRLPSTTIPSGTELAVSYTYNNTPTLPLAGELGAVSGSTLVDGTKNFTAVIPGRKLRIDSGPNAGEYTVSGVPTPSQVVIVETFPEDQAGDVIYSVDAFPHGIKIDKSIVSIPHLRDRIDVPSLVLVENVDYVVRDGLLAVRTGFPMSTLGPAEVRARQMWAETTKVDKETPFRNFGVLIDFYRQNSEAYKLALQGLWYTFWTGSTPGNLQRGLHILLGLPFAKRAGTVTRVDTTAGEIDITDERGQIITYAVPEGLDVVVAKGASVARFDALTTGVAIIDRNNEPGFVTHRLGRGGIERFLTSKATRGVGDTDETKALTLLENHLFLPQVLAEAITHRVNVSELVTFLDNMKPQWTEYVFSFAVEENETVTLTEDLPPYDLAMDLTTTVSNNQWNQSFAFNNFLIDSVSGEIIAGGTQATGNFRDLARDFAALGVDAGDVVRIASGLFVGYHSVIRRVSTHVLALDIPDALITAALDLPYIVIPSERNLDNDTANLGHEHVLLSGTEFLVPSSLNTKTDIDLLATMLSNDDIKALVLVDASNVGAEVQDITDADNATNEIEVGTPPSVGVQDHQISSCALIRTDNAGPTVTDAFAI